MRSAPSPDLDGAAERLRSWLDDMAVDPSGGRDQSGASGLADWYRVHSAGLIAAALALEELAASTRRADEPDDADRPARLDA